MLILLYQETIPVVVTLFWKIIFASERLGSIYILVKVLLVS